MESAVSDTVTSPIFLATTTFRIQKSPYRGWHLLLGDRLAGTVSTSKAAYANYAVAERGTR